MYTSLFLLVLATALPRAAAHGVLGKITIDGKDYAGNAPNAKATASVIRQVDTIDPVKGASNANLACGSNAQLATLQADAQPGSSVQVFWADPNGSNVRLSLPPPFVLSHFHLPAFISACIPRAVLHVPSILPSIPVYVCMLTPLLVAA
jgi:hypothetical protein